MSFWSTSKKIGVIYPFVLSLALVLFKQTESHIMIFQSYRPQFQFFYFNNFHLIVVDGAVGFESSDIKLNYKKKKRIWYKINFMCIKDIVMWCLLKFYLYSIGNGLFHDSILLDWNSKLVLLVILKKKLVMLEHWFCIRFKVWQHERKQKKGKKKKYKKWSTFLYFISCPHFLLYFVALDKIILKKQFLFFIKF